MATITVSELRANLREAIERARRGEELLITRNDEVAAVLVHPSRLRSRAVTPITRMADELDDDLRRRRSEPGPLRPGTLSAERAEELTGWIRSGRESR